MNSPFDWEEEWDWVKQANSELNPGQLSFFSPDKDNFLNSGEKNNNFSSFEDVIFKNPAYTVEEIYELMELAKEMKDA